MIHQHKIQHTRNTKKNLILFDYKKKPLILQESSLGHIDGSNIFWVLLCVLLRNCHLQHPVFESAFDIIRVSILGQPKPPHETAKLPLQAVPLVVSLLLLLNPLPAYLQHVAVLHVNLHVLFFHS